MKRFLILTLSLIFSRPLVSYAVTIDLEASRTSCVAPCGVFFDATGTTDPSLDPFTELNYAWDFGDPNSIFQNRPELDANSANGAIAAHVFDQPGNYNVQLTVDDNRGNQQVSNINIQVINPDAAFPGNQTRCVSRAGNFSGCPPGAEQVTSFNFDDQVNWVFGGNSRRVLFKRGETFNSDDRTPHSSLNNGPYLIGAFGVGNNPRIFNVNMSTPPGSAMMVARSGSDITVSSLHFESQYDPTTGLGPRVSGIFMNGLEENAEEIRLVTIFRNSFKGLAIGVQLGQTTSVQDAVIGDNHMSKWHNYGSLSGVAHRVAYIGNVIRQAANAVHNPDGKEHFDGITEPNWSDHGPIRVAQGDRVLIWGNDLYSKTGWVNLPQPTIRLGTSGLADQCLVSNNILQGGSPILYAKTANDEGVARGGFTIWEKNTLLAENYTRTFFETRYGGQIFRNNLLIRPESAEDDIRAVLDFETVPLTTNENLTRLNQIYGNTYVAHGNRSAGKFTWFRADGVRNFDFKNNIMYAANQDVFYFMERTDGLLNLESDNNLMSGNTNTSFYKDPNQTNFTLSQWQNLSGNDGSTIMGDPVFENVAANDFRLRSNSPARGAGDQLNELFEDFSEVSRPVIGGSNPDMGALQYGSTLSNLPPRNDPPVQVRHQNSPAGMNLSAITQHSPQWIFKNIMLQSDPWRPLNGSPSFNLDSDGYVTSLEENQTVRTFVYTGLENHMPGGNYTLLYDGEGEIEVNRTVYTNGQTVHIPASNGQIEVRLNSTNPNNYVRNLRLIAPGTENGQPFIHNYEQQPFQPAFLESLSMFKTLRFMDWFETNNSLHTNPEDITPFTAFTQGVQTGAAPEYFALLANALQADAWINIPHLATNEYIEAYAKRLKDVLHTDRKLYVEYSNEVWRFGFDAAPYAEENGLDEELNTSVCDKESDPPRLQGCAEAQLRWYSKRSVEVFREFDRVFNGTSNNQLVKVLGSHFGSAWRSNIIMDFQDAYLEADVLAVAPYINLRRNPDRSRYTADQLLFMGEGGILTDMEHYIDENMLGLIQDQVAAAEAHNLRLVAYEGGPGLVGLNELRNDDRITELFGNTNRNPRMEEVYSKLLDAWKDLGGTDFVAFNSIRKHNNNGSWGHMEYQDQDIQTAPKYLAITDFAYNAGRWWEGSSGNIAPIANAGDDRTVTLVGGQTTVAVVLDGSRSVDPGGSIVTYRWSGNPNPSNIIQPIVHLGQGAHVFTLEVEDNEGITDTDTVRITVEFESQNPPPPPSPDPDPGPNPGPNPNPPGGGSGNTNQPSEPFDNVLDTNANDVVSIPCVNPVQIVDRSGQIIRIVNCVGNPGMAQWDGRNSAGDLVSAGLYLVVEPPGQYRKVVVLK